ncbi:MAG TPA: energy-coupling factor transporter transmembrane component T [Bacteroidota bacterium]|nr:energy-coupling factor transporter transmembrane component T [Bacteroidota bacterium]
MNPQAEKRRPPFIRDPLARIIIVGCISFGALAHTPLRYTAAAALIYGAWMVAGGIPPGAVFGKLRRAFLFLGIILFVNGVTESGRVLYEAGGLYLTEEGLLRGGEQALRLCIVLWGAFLLVSSGQTEEFQDAAERWTARKGHPLVAAGTIAITYLPMLVESARRVTIARRARGEADRVPFPGGLSRVAGAALPLLAAALRNADALAEAMESRCYDPSYPRTRFRTLRVGPRDVSIVAAVVMYTAASCGGIA